MLYKIMLWLGIAVIGGSWLNYLFEPVEPHNVWLLYGLALLFFGWIENRRIGERYSWLSLQPFLSPNARYKKLTFWGVPIPFTSETPISKATALRGESFLPVSVAIILTPKQVRTARSRSVAEAFRQFDPRQLHEIDRQLAAKSPGRSRILRSMQVAAKATGGFLYWLKVAWLQLKLWLKLVLTFGMFFLACAAGVWYFLPNKDQIDQIVSHVQLKVFKDGDKLELIDAVNDLSISLDQIPKYFRQALVFKEDRRFYTHWSWDWYGKGRAVIETAKFLARYLKKMVIGGQAGSLQGGSTITEQLARNLMLATDDFSGKQENALVKACDFLRRKFKEWVFGFKLERYYSKDAILEMYLNKIFFGPGTNRYGVEVAALTYFHKRTKDLSLFESALLIQAITNPSSFNSNTNQQLAKKRAEDLVLTPLVKQIAQHGAFRLGEDAVDLTRQQVDQSVRQGVRPGKQTLTRREVRYHWDWILKQLQDEPYFKRLRGAFTVVTTLNATMQFQAEKAINTVLTDEARQRFDASQTALVALAPDGAVQALMGGNNYAEIQYSLATEAQRPPGSTFKLFVYLTALQHGWKLDDLIDDTPITVGGKPINNWDGKFWGPISLVRAFAGSRNAAAIRLILKDNVGVPNVMNLARQLGIASELNAEARLALGSSNVNLLELTSAYTVLANRGFAVKPYGIIGVRTRSGQIRYWHTIPRQTIFRVIPVQTPLVAQKQVVEMNALLKAVVNSADGTGHQVQFPQAGFRLTAQSLERLTASTLSASLLRKLKDLQDRLFTEEVQFWDVLTAQIGHKPTKQEKHLIRDVVEYEIGGKTGTTDESRNAVFVGCTAHLCAGVWVGNPDNSPMNDIHGGDLPARIFREFMQQTYHAMNLAPDFLP